MGFNSPLLQTADGLMKKVYTHQTLTFDHYGIHVSIKTNGKVVIQGNAQKADDGTVEYDEVEIPASLVFKLAGLLKTTRTETLVPVSTTGESEKE